MLRRALCLLLLLVSAPSYAQDRLLVFAAVSLTDALTGAGAAYEKQGRRAPVFSFGASSTLARQIENGAPAGLFISADEEWMDYLAARALIDRSTRVSVLGNTLVLIAPEGEALNLRIAPGFGLARALNGRKLALADPTSVPAGRYAQSALRFLGAWRAVEPFVVRADNVRAALAFVERKEAAAGIVYATDAAQSNKVKMEGVFPAESHPPISYPVAVVAAHDTPSARAFHAFLQSEAAKAVFRSYGFAVR